jgi:hypothetical protein
MKKELLLLAISIFTISNAEAVKIVIDSIELDSSVHKFFKADHYKHGSGSLIFFPKGYGKEKLLSLDGVGYPKLKTDLSMSINKEIELPEDAEGLRVSTSGAGTLASNPDWNTNVQDGESYKVILSNFRLAEPTKTHNTMDIKLVKVSG